MSHQIIRADARHLPLADASVDLVVTSPPYFGLRSYQDGGEHYDGQLGSETTPAEFVDALIECTREMVRVLKPSGSIWVNLGDKYAGSNGQAGGTDRVTLVGTKQTERTGRGFVAGGAPAKSLIGIPWRYALRCIDDLGLILRAEVIWAKPNGLPESVTDRVRRSHEQWFWFQRSGGVEAAAQGFPFCPLCGRPVDARTTLVERLKKLDGSVVPLDLADEVGAHQRVQGDSTSGANLDHRGVPNGTGVSLLVEGDAALGQHATDLLQDSIVGVVEHDAQVRVPIRSAGQAHGSFAVEDASKPGDVCRCVGHPLIVDDEPWIPQRLAAEIMQLVADGECDPQAAADYLSGDYARSHSVWFHFTREPRYFSAVDEIREDHAAVSVARSMPHRAQPGRRSAEMYMGDAGHTLDRDQMLNPLGKLPGSVWTIPTQPLTVPAHLGVDHFAAFPMEWPRRIIRGWSPSGICTACGEGRQPVAATTYEHVNFTSNAKTNRGDEGVRRQAPGFVARGQTTIIGESCACPEPSAPTRPAVILDPFGGTGTTALVADVLGRHGISVDMSADYCRLATWRCNDPGERARAMQVEKPPAVLDGQLDLFEGVSA